MKKKIATYIAKIDGLSIRERALIFAAAAFAVASLMDTFLLAPLLKKQKGLSDTVIQQQEKMKEVQANLANLLEAKRNDENSPLRQQMVQLRQQITDGENYLKQQRDKLVAPDQMAGLLEQVLGQNQRVQLVNLKTLPVTLLIDPKNTKGDAATARALGLDKQVYKHGIELTVRGNYADLLDYLAALEKLPQEMFWGAVRMKVVSHPQIEITLTVYTLSLDTTWLQV